jgi:hypothetical protein
LVRRGFSVVYSDYESVGSGPTHDFAAERDGVEIAVECRAFTWDAAKKIHRHDFWRLAELVIGELQGIGIPHPIRVRVNLTSRLPTDERQLRDMAVQVAKAIRLGLGQLGEQEPPGIAGIVLEVLPSAAVGALHAEALVEANSGGHVMVICDDKSRALVFAVASIKQEDDELPKRLVKDLKGKARRQFGDHSARVLAVLLEDLPEAALPGLAEKGVLQSVASGLLGGEPAIHSVVFHGMPELGSAPRGSTLVFRQPAHALANTVRFDLPA